MSKRLSIVLDKECRLVAQACALELTSAMQQHEMLDAANWEDDTSRCGLCDLRLGKRYLRRRHHCRACGRCVCAECSPNRIPVRGYPDAQRVCMTYTLDSPVEPLDGTSASLSIPQESEALNPQVGLPQVEDK